MLEIKRDGELALLELARGKGNSLDASFLKGIRTEFENLRAEPPRGEVLTASGKLFCAGLDLVALKDARQEQVEELVSELADTLLEIFTVPRPVVAAINGHAVAGGALLTLACDRRLMAMGDGRWGLTESQLGLVVPASMIEMARYSLPRTVLERLLYGGQAYPAFKAREMGVLDDLLEVDELLPRAGELIEDWTPVPEAFAEIKSRLKAPTVQAMESARAADTAFVGRWFSPDVRQRVGQAVERLVSPK